MIAKYLYIFAVMTDDQKGFSMTLQFKKKLSHLFYSLIVKTVHRLIQYDQ